MPDYFGWITYLVGHEKFNLAGIEVYFLGISQDCRIDLLSDFSRQGGFKYQVQQGLMTSLRRHLSQLQHFVIDLKRGSEPMNFSRSVIHLPGNLVEIVLRVPG